MSDDINIKIAAQNAASAALRQTAVDSQFLANKLGVLQHAAGMMKGLMFQAFGGLAAGQVVKASLNAWAEQETAVKRLEAVLTATHGAAGLSSQAIQDFAGELQKTTRFADETTAAAASVLGTFTKIKGDQFTASLRAAADIATIRDMGLTEAATLIGKALQAPADGLAKLKKVGIAFDEQTASNIRSLASLGQTAQAQQAVLDGINARFGGAAQRDAETMAGKIDLMKNAWGDLAEVVGSALAGPLTKAAEMMRDIATGDAARQRGAVAPKKVSQAAIQAALGGGDLAQLRAQQKALIDEEQVLQTKIAKRGGGTGSAELKQQLKQNQLQQAALREQQQEFQRNDFRRRGLGMLGRSDGNFPVSEGMAARALVGEQNRLPNALKMLGRPLGDIDAARALGLPVPAPQTGNNFAPGLAAMLARKKKAAIEQATGLPDYVPATVSRFMRFGTNSQGRNAKDKDEKDKNTAKLVELEEEKKADRKMFNEAFRLIAGQAGKFFDNVGVDAGN